MANIVIVETNEGVPRCLGGHSENIHISEVYYVVPAPKSHLLATAKPQASPEDEKIAQFILEKMHDGACLQLGIGRIPNMVVSLIAESDLKDLGMYSEMMCDAFMDPYDKGKITRRHKATNRNKMIYTFVIGRAKLYEFINDTPVCATYPVDYTNSMENITRNDNAIGINNADQVDLYGQIASEAIGKSRYPVREDRATLLSAWRNLMVARPLFASNPRR